MLVVQECYTSTRVKLYSLINATCFRQSFSGGKRNDAKYLQWPPVNNLINIEFPAAAFMQGINF
jgi:hypothetical protein